MNSTPLWRERLLPAGVRSDCIAERPTEIRRSPPLVLLGRAGTLIVMGPRDADLGPADRICGERIVDGARAAEECILGVTIEAVGRRWGRTNRTLDRRWLVDPIERGALIRDRLRTCGALPMLRDGARLIAADLVRILG